MAWTYDPTNLDDSTQEGRKNIVRLLIGDTDIDDQQMQDEEIFFALDQANDNVYAAAIWCTSTLVSKYSRMVNTEIDDTLKAEYSDIAKNYRLLKSELEDQQKKSEGSSLGAAFLGTKTADLCNLRSDSSRTQPSFYKGQFDVYKDC